MSEIAKILEELRTLQTNLGKDRFYNTNQAQLEIDAALDGGLISRTINLLESLNVLPIQEWFDAEGVTYDIREGKLHFNASMPWDSSECLGGDEAHNLCAVWQDDQGIHFEGCEDGINGVHSYLRFLTLEDWKIYFTDFMNAAVDELSKYNARSGG